MMNYDVSQITVVGKWRLFVRFADGIAGYVRLKEGHLNRPAFQPLRDPAVFASAYIAHGAVTWCDGKIDLAPDAMHTVIKTHGEWVLD